MQKKKKEFFSYHAYSRIKQNRVWNRIYYFEIAVSLNFEQGTSKSGKLKWKHRQTSLEFFHSWFSSFNWQKCGNVKIIFPVLYHIIHNSDLGQGKNQQIFHKIFHFFLTLIALCFVPATSWNQLVWLFFGTRKRIKCAFPTSKVKKVETLALLSVPPDVQKLLLMQAL